MVSRRCGRATTDAGVRDSINHGRISRARSAAFPIFRRPAFSSTTSRRCCRIRRGSGRRSTAWRRRFSDQGIDLVVGIESRGFIFGAAVADRIGAGFSPVRKPGKLPSRTDAADLRPRVRHRRARDPRRRRAAGAAGADRRRPARDGRHREGDERRWCSGWAVKCMRWRSSSSWWRSTAAQQAPGRTGAHRPPGTKCCCTPRAVIVSAPRSWPPRASWRGARRRRRGAAPAARRDAADPRRCSRRASRRRPRIRARCSSGSRWRRTARALFPDDSRRSIARPGATFPFSAEQIAGGARALVGGLAGLGADARRRVQAEGGRGRRRAARLAGIGRAARAARQRRAREARPLSAPLRGVHTA